MFGIFKPLNIGIDCRVKTTDIATMISGECIGDTFSNDAKAYLLSILKIKTEVVNLTRLLLVWLVFLEIVASLYALLIFDLTMNVQFGD